MADSMLVAVLEHRVAILERRLSHTEIELSQARASREDHRRKLLDLLVAIDEAGFEVVGEGYGALKHQVPGGENG